MIPNPRRTITRGLLCVALLGAACVAQSTVGVNDVSSEQFNQRVTTFLGREIAAHVADLNSLDPPQQRVVGAQTGGEFTWGAFTRALASYSALSGDKTLAGNDLPKLIGQLGLIEARRGGKTFAQLNAAIALRHFGTDLSKNAVWQALTPTEQVEWRSLLDPARFYDRKARNVIHLPENYLGVAARLATMDYQMGIITDRAYVNDILDRAADQFTDGHLYSDDALPTGRYDRYSNEYARYVYFAAENIGRTDVMQKLEPSLKAQMQTWWDLLSPDGYGYPWGRSLGAISYEDTLEIVGFLAAHPQFRPTLLTELASAYYAAWNWLENDCKEKPHLLNVFGFGRGNYSYVNQEREWQQTTAFFGKASSAEISLRDALKKDSVNAFPATPHLPDVTRFEFFRKGDRPSGVWLVRRPGMQFVLPIVTGTRPGMSDYLPAPYNFAGFAAPVEQLAPSLTPYLELADGRTVIAGDAADEIIPSPDALSVRAVWKRWAILGTQAGTPQDVGLMSEVTWRVEGSQLIRSETISTSKPIHIRRFWMIVPSTYDRVSTKTDQATTAADFVGKGANLNVIIESAQVPLRVEVVATGNSALGKGSQGAIPLYLDVRAKDVTITPGSPLQWTIVMQPKTVTTRAPQN